MKTNLHSNMKNKPINWSKILSTAIPIFIDIIKAANSAPSPMRCRNCEIYESESNGLCGLCLNKNALPPEIVVDTKPKKTGNFFDEFEIIL